jgi:uncharacterized protein involved in exopolysaccharide biosynthesis/Mrp family chromosome partitioning ATPase
MRATTLSAADSVHTVAAISGVEVFRGVWRRKILPITTSAIALGLAAIFLASTEPTYRTQAHVLVESLETPFNRSQSETTLQDRSVDELELASQIEVMSSRDLQLRVVKALELDELPETVTPVLKPHHKLMIALGFKDDPRKQTVEQRALAKLSKALKIYAAPGSRVIIIKSSSLNSQQAAAIANSLAEVYVAATREFATSNTARARDWLADEIAKLRDKVATSEAAAEEFRAAHGLLKGTQVTLEAQELSELNTQLTLAEIAKLEVHAKATTIRDLLKTTGTIDASSVVLESPLMQKLQEQQILLKRQVAENSAVYLENHPRMVALGRDIARLNAEIRNEAAKILVALDNQAKAAEARAAALRASLDQLMAKAAASNQNDVKLRALEREAAANRVVLETYLSRLSDASSRVSLVAQPGLARIIQRADAPASPSFPKAGPILLLAGLGGSAMGLGLAFMASIMSAAEAANRAQHTAAMDFASVAGGNGPLGTEIVAPALCEMAAPADREKAGAISAAIVDGLSGDLARSARQIASWVMSEYQVFNARRVAVNGFLGGELASATIAVSLARVLALQGNNCILIDADFVTGSVSSALSIAPAAGLGELLLGRASFSDLCRKDPLSNLDVVQAGKAPQGAVLPAGPLMTNFFETLERRYRFIILHQGAHLGDASEVWKACHAGLIVAATDHAAQIGARLKAMQAAGLSSTQFVRIVKNGQPRHGTNPATAQNPANQKPKVGHGPIDIGSHEQGKLASVRS